MQTAEGVDAVGGRWVWVLVWGYGVSGSVRRAIACCSTMHVLLVVRRGLKQDARRVGVRERHGHRSRGDADGEAEALLQPVGHVGVVHGRGEQRPPAAVV